MRCSSPNQQTDGATTGVYHQGPCQTLLSEGSLLYHGGARNATTSIREWEVLEVSWLSGTGRGVAVLSQWIEKTPSRYKVQEEEVQYLGQIWMPFENLMRINWISRVLTGRPWKHTIRRRYQSQGKRHGMLKISKISRIYEDLVKDGATQLPKVIAGGDGGPDNPIL